MENFEGNVEELQQEYLGLLKARNEETLKQLTRPVSRLEDDSHGRDSSNMGGSSKTIDFSAVREHFKARNGIELSGKSYGSLVADLQSGVYRNKDRHIDASP